MKELWQIYFFEKTNKPFIQLVRYTFVGGFAFVVDFSLLWFLTRACGVYYLISASLSFVAGLIVNYLISTKWVFYESKFSNKKMEFVFYGLIGVVGLAVNDLFIWVFTHFFDLHYLFSKVVTVVLVYLWNFFARKYLLFNN